MVKTIPTKLVGVTFGDIQSNIQTCSRGDVLTLLREPNNQYDSNAIKVFKDELPLGYISRAMAAKLAPFMDAGKHCQSIIDDITGGGSYNYGVNILISITEDRMEDNYSISSTGNEYTLFDMPSITAAIIEDIDTYHC